MFGLRRKLFVAWIALFAVLYAAATPVLSALRSQSRLDVLGAICTLDGVKETSGKPIVPAERGAGHQQHCVFCIGGAWQPPLDVALTVPVPAATGGVLHRGRENVLQSSFASLQPLSPRAPPRLV